MTTTISVKEIITVRCLWCGRDIFTTPEYLKGGKGKVYCLWCGKHTKVYDERDI